MLKELERGRNNYLECIYILCLTRENEFIARLCSLSCLMFFQEAVHKKYMSSFCCDFHLPGLDSTLILA